MTRGVIGFISPLWVLFVLWAYSCTVTFPALGLLPLVGALLGLIAAYLGWSSSACRCSGSSSSGMDRVVDGVRRRRSRRAVERLSGVDLYAGSGAGPSAEFGPGLAHRGHQVRAAIADGCIQLFGFERLCRPGRARSHLGRGGGPHLPDGGLRRVQGRQPALVTERWRR